MLSKIKPHQDQNHTVKIHCVNVLTSCSWNNIFLLLMLAQAMPVNAQDLVSAYQDYTIRAKVLETMNVASPIKVSVIEYYFEYEKFPNDLEQLKQTGSLDQLESKYAKSFQINKGVIQVILNFKPLEDKSYILSPKVNKESTIDWTCESHDILQNYLPGSCKSSMVK